LPDDAILVGTGDHRFFGHLYAGRAQQHRSDITYLDAHMTAYDWYRRRLTNRLNVQIPGLKDGDIKLVSLMDELSKTGRRICITHIFHPSLIEQMRWIPVGTAKCLATANPPPPLESYQRQMAWIRSARNAPPPTPPRPSWAAESLQRYSDNFGALSRALDATGHSSESREANSLQQVFTRPTN
jgi:hypothetical protein